MAKTSISVAIVGHMPFDLDTKKIMEVDSEVFQISGEIETYSIIQDSDGDNWEFSDSSLEKILPNNFSSDIMLIIINVPIELNWYSRRLSNNRAVFTFHEIKEILNHSNIPLENIIHRCLYAYTLIYKRFSNRIPLGSEETNFTHDETRGCLFDMNGIKSDIIYSCHNPIICSDCTERMRREKISNELITTVKKEIKRIRKPLFYRMMEFIKKHPVWSLVISMLSAILLGAIGSVLASYIYAGLTRS